MFSSWIPKKTIVMVPLHDTIFKFLYNKKIAWEAAKQMMILLSNILQFKKKRMGMSSLRISSSLRDSLNFTAFYTTPSPAKRRDAAHYL